jgi:hypothetical protein
LAPKQICRQLRLEKIERERRTEPADLNFSRPPMS